MTYKAKQRECKGSYGEHWNSVVNSLREKVFMVLKFLSIHKGWVQNRVLLLMCRLSKGWPVSMNP